MPDTERLDSKPRTLKELAAAYSVSQRTMRKWLRLNPQTRLLYQFRGGYYFTILDVRCIIRALVEP